jgi:hypothetical protein
MAAAYRRTGLHVEFIEVKNAGHDLQQTSAEPISPSVEYIHQRTIDFFEKYLVTASPTDSNVDVFESPGHPRSLANWSQSEPVFGARWFET